MYFIHQNLFKPKTHFLYHEL